MEFYPHLISKRLLPFLPHEDLLSHMRYIILLALVLYPAS